VETPVALGAVRLRAPDLPRVARELLERAVGAEHVLDDAETRVLRCRGKSYLDLLAQRAGDCEGAPDAVVRPADHDQVAAVLRACVEANLAVVPFGGGTSVVGGLEASREGFAGIVSLDLGRMDALESIDERSLTAVFAPGIRLPEAERALGARGLRLAHVPQSFEWATVGGCVATRSAGQSSTGHGRIEENVVALRCATPAGELANLPVPSTAAGPALKQLVMGSEGILGAITSVGLRVFPLPAARRYEGFAFRDFEAGWDALRGLAQDELAPDIARLSDEAETRMSFALAGNGAKARAMGAVLGGRCVLVCGWEGSEVSVALRRKLEAKALRGAGGWPLGQSPGEAWAATRYAGPHLRDDLLDRGVMVETLETATTWSNLAALRSAVTRALEGSLPAPLVLCHLSHVYPTGASLYFTAFAAQHPDDPAGQWRRAKTAATDAIVATGGTITHHHAVGADHAPWLGAEDGELGLDVLRALKERCDPAGIMNPGKLLL
jgi:alkyldihydroxyacetonephosphate synthase